MEELTVESISETKGRIGFHFSGKGGEYFKIWIINILLSIITLGIYSAWAKVRRKRYFYGCTTLDGSSFEYHADPTRILKGRLIVYGLYAIFAVLGKIMPTLSIVFTLAFVVLIPYFIEKSLRFNAINSSYRNVRFGYEMNYKKALFVFVGLGFLTLMTLGLLFPYYIFRIKKHILDNSRYGLQHFQFNGKSSDFYKIYSAPSVVLLVIVAIGLLLGKMFMVFLPFVAVLVFMVGYAYITVSQTNYVLDSLMLRENSFRSDMKTANYMWISISNYVLIVLSLGLLAPFAKIRASRYRVENISLYAFGDINAFVAEEFSNVGATGEELTDMFDLEFGL